MSIARHHNEWLSLVEVSGPFLSIPVLMRTFPQGLDALDRDMLAELRLAYEEWLDDQNSLRPSPAIHSVWVRYVLERVLGFDKSRVLEGPAIPTAISAYIAEQGETLRPDLVVSGPPQNPGEGTGVRLLVQVLPVAQGLEKTMQNHRWKASPAMRMLELLRLTGVQLGLVTNGEQWMLVSAPKGETSTFVSWYAALWLEEPLTLRAFTSLLGDARFFAMAEEDSLAGMLKESANEQQEVTSQLGYQVRRAVEVLIRAIDKADQDRGRTLLKDIKEKDLYEAALTVMMRLVFLFSAEERGLLLLGDPIYDGNYAVSTLRSQLRETADHLGEEVLERRFDAWCRLLATFRAVHGGIHHDRLNLPAYGGSLFDPERYPFLEGRLPSPEGRGDGSEGKGEGEVLPISNRTVLHLLDALQVLRVKVPGGGPAEARRLSFRSLDVEQIGHVYEGLLDHTAVRAGEPVLGLVGTRDSEPEIPLSILKTEAARGEKSFLAFLKLQTGRSENALRNAWQQKADVFNSQHLQIACNNDTEVYNQVAEFAGLIRADDFGCPTVFLQGSVYVTAGTARRATGTHYTPRSLTEPIVQHTLEPLVYTGPAEGLPKEEWTLKSPAELLELKVCDMAMGSAGFLVQVIRYLSERLVEAWDALTPGSSPIGRGELRITPEGKLATGKPGELIIPADDEERLVLARRLVADRCIYGVDKNPLAVEIAKLSIWLTTMDKGRPFTFLDHALKCGDSLVGADEEMFKKWALSRKDAAYTLDYEVLNQQLELARQKRRELENFTVLDVRDAEHKAALLKEADAAMARVKLGCNLLVGVRLLGLKPAEQETLLSQLLWDYVAGLPMDTPDAQRALHAARKERAFHWPFEFPEVFINEGFNAFVGNPPFLGGKKISTYFGSFYQEFLKTTWPHAKGAADFCSYFFLRAEQLLRKKSHMGLIATNSISQADTREIGLEYLLQKGNSIYRAIPTLPWPGIAGVSIAVVHVYKGKWGGPFVLNNSIKGNISSFLDEGISTPPKRLKNNRGKISEGTKIYGQGFLLSPEEAAYYINNDSKNKNVIFPYLIGDEVNSSPNLEPSRFVINFGTRELADAMVYKDLFTRVTNTVKPEREKMKGQIHENRYWLFWDKREELYKEINKLESVLVCSVTSKYLAIAEVPSSYVFAQTLKVFTFPTQYFSLLQSTIHEVWARKYCTTFGNTFRYSASDAFETFTLICIELFPNLITIGEEYKKLRKNIMRKSDIGLTNLYNKFHNLKEKDKEVLYLREIQAEMDNAVATAYGWSDLDLGHGFHETPQGVRFTISESARREVLSRLLQLNHERYEEEVHQGLHEKDRKKANKEEKPARQKPKRLAQPAAQMDWLEEPEHASEAESEAALPASPSSEIGSWDKCKCLGCGKTVIGFSIAEHTRVEHQGKDPRYRKMGN